MNMILIWFAIKYKGNWDLIFKALENKEKVSLKELTSMEEKLKQEHMGVITILDLDYPKQLKRAYKPPFVLFYKGDKRILKNNFLCTSGNALNVQVKEWIKTSNKEIAKRHGFVSSLYKGVDEFVYAQAKNNNAKILLVGCNGLDDPYFSVNIKNHPNVLLVSEFPNGTHVSKERLISRNRIVAAFAEKLILYSSKKGGGIMNLVSNFLNQGKEVYCYPGYGGLEDGNSELIKQGANMITSIKEIRE